MGEWAAVVALRRKLGLLKLEEVDGAYLLPTSPVRVLKVLWPWASGDLVAFGDMDDSFTALAMKAACFLARFHQRVRTLFTSR